MAQSPPSAEPAEAPDADSYGELMPVRRLSLSGPDLLTADAAPDLMPVHVPDVVEPPPLAADVADVSEPVEDAPGAGAAMRDIPAASPAIPTQRPDLAPPATLASPSDQAARGAPFVASDHPPKPLPADPQAGPPVVAVPSIHSFKVPPVTWETLNAMGRLALQQGDPVVATDWFWLARVAFPTVFHGYTEGALALADLALFDDGRRLLDEASALIHDEPAISVARAQLETKAGALTEAVEHWRKAMAYPSGPWWICLLLVEALEKLSRHDEANAVLQDVLRAGRLTHPGLLEKAVAMAAARKDWPEVAERLMALGNSVPAEGLFSIDLDALLIALRDGDPGAFATLIQAPWVGALIDSEQTDPDRLIKQARVAQLSGRGADAMARLATLRAVMPRSVDAYLRTESVLRDANATAGADAMLDEAVRLMPDEPALWVRIGDRVEARGDWKEARQHWINMGQRFPGHAYPGYRLQQASLRLHDEDSDGEMKEAEQTGGNGDLREFAFAFESLGGTGFAGGCEFGGVQRIWGAEPLGLFRWAAVSPQTLVACLEQRFAGIGDVAQTELFESDESSVLLWEIRDKRYGYDMHSFIRVADMEHERMLQTACRRMRYLAEKMLQDLEHPTKIFVHKTAGRRLDHAEIEALSNAIALYPGMRLLCVVGDDAEHPDGTVEAPAPNLMVAAMDFSAGHDWEQRIGTWEKICRQALDAWQPAEVAAPYAGNLDVEVLVVDTSPGDEADAESHSNTASSNVLLGSSVDCTLGYLYCNGGLNNQKLALLGLIQAAKVQRLPITLPKIFLHTQETYHADVASHASGLTPPVRGSHIPFGEVFDLELLSTFAESEGIKIVDGPPHADVSGWDYFNKGANTLYESGVSGTALTRGFFKSLNPKMVRTEILQTLLGELERRGIFVVLQCRIERDWLTHTGRGHSAPVVTFDDIPGLIDLFSKVRTTLRDDIQGGVYLVNDEAGLPLPKETLREEIARRFGIQVNWKSDFDAEVLTRYNSLEQSILDFEISVHAKIFVGASFSTFSNISAYERFVRTGQRARNRYIYNIPGEILWERVDNGVTSDPLQAISKPVVSNLNLD